MEASSWRTWWVAQPTRLPEEELRARKSMRSAPTHDGTMSHGYFHRRQTRDRQTTSRSTSRGRTASSSTTSRIGSEATPVFLPVAGQEDGHPREDQPEP